MEFLADSGIISFFMQLKDLTQAEFYLLVSELFGADSQIQSIQHVDGGSINETFKVSIGNKIVFVKRNEAKKYPQLFGIEARGLQLIEQTSCIKTPQVLLSKIIVDKQFLVLEYIEPGVRAKSFWIDFGTALAKLHKNTNKHFGLDHDNYIGSLRQSNLKHDGWVEFFILCRLEPQIKMVRDAGRIGQSCIRCFDSLFNKLRNIFPEERPALLHGDLWSGNFMIGRKGDPVLIDPAVYYGHREIDLAMTKLFGGFESEFYHSYNREFILEKGWEARVEICNLYPLMVHVNLFGGSYSEQVEDILRQF